MSNSVLPEPIVTRLSFLSGQPHSVEKKVLPSSCPNPVRFSAKLYNLLDYSYSDNPPAVNSGAYTIDCNRKSCEYCAEKNRKKLVAHYTRVYGGLDSVSILTLTIDPKVFNEKKYTRLYLLHCWSKFRKRINRELKSKGKKQFIFTLMLEKHKDGRYHAHVLTNINLPYRTVQDHWMQSGGGISMYYDRDIEKKMIPRVVGYNVKYIFKNYDSVKYERALMNSRGISINSKEQKEKVFNFIAEKLNSDVRETPEGKKFINKQRFEHIKWKYDLPETVVNNLQYAMKYISPYTQPNWETIVKNDHEVTVVDKETGEVIREYIRMTSDLKKWFDNVSQKQNRSSKIKFKDKTTKEWFQLEYGKEPVKL